MTPLLNFLLMNSFLTRVFHVTYCFCALCSSSIYASNNNHIDSNDTFPRCIYSQIFVENNNKTKQFSINLFQFDKYNINKFTKKDREFIPYFPIDQYINNTNNEQCIVKTNPIEIYSVHIEKNKNIKYYIDLLLTLMDNNKQLNIKISKENNYNKEMSKMLNYAPSDKVKLMFGIFLDNIINEMINSNLVKEYNLKDKIIQFNNNCIEYEDNNKKLQNIWQQFKSSIELYLTECDK